MIKPRILITLPISKVRDTFFPEHLVSALREHYKLLWNDTDQNWTSKELAQKIGQAQGCILGWGAPYWSSEVVTNIRDLRCVGILGGAVRPYLGPEIFAAQIPVFNASGIMAQSVAEAVIAYSLAALRELPQYMGAMKSGTQWRDNDYWVEGLLYKTVGLVGYGAVGRYLAQQLQVFHCDLLIYDPFYRGELPPRARRVDSLEELFSRSKIISLQAAYTPQTHHLVSHTQLDLLPAGSVLINVGRGGLIDEEALVSRLQRGDVKAVLDVFTEEPLALDSPLRGLANAYLVPHMAGPTPDLRWKMTAKVFRDFDAVFQGQPYGPSISWEQVQAMT